MNASHYQVRVAAGIAVLLAAALLLASTKTASSQPANSKDPEKSKSVEGAPKKSEDKTVSDEKLEQATFGTGCFWCSEAVFSELKGVKSAVSGYSGGRVADPDYHSVSTGMTGHAEVVQVTYDPTVITYPELLEVFWQVHDPTTLNRQGPDVGTQYRSVIFYHTEEQKKAGEHYKKELNESGAFNQPIVTEITEFKKFYPAEDYHQNYFAANPRQDYCRAVVRPKVEKFRKVFHQKLKDAQERKEFEK
jgi:peptide-methionine (S)-S-oxide reductase